MADNHNEAFSSIDCDSEPVGGTAAESTTSWLLKTDSSREQGLYLSSIRTAVMVNGLELAENTLLWGFAMGLTSQEITDFIRSDPQGRASAEAIAQARYRVKIVGAIFGDANQWDGPLASARDTALWDVRFPRWYIPEGSSLRMFLHNCGSTNMASGVDFRYVVDVRGTWGSD